MEQNSVAVTGVGLVSPLGLDADSSWERLIRGESGISYKPREGTTAEFHYQGAVDDPCEVPEDVGRQLTSQIRFLNRSSLLGLSAARQAFLAAGVDAERVPAKRRALYIGSGDFTSVGYEFMYPAMRQASDERWQRVDQARLNQGAIDLVNPFFLLESLNNNLFSFLSAYLGFMGSGTALSAQSPCGSNALELAYRSIRQGRAELALAVGCGNWLSDIPVYEMKGLGLLSQCRQGADSYRPLSRGRDGFILGEGGAALLLEDHATAVARGADVLGVIKGVGNSMSTLPDKAFGVTPEAYIDAIESAIHEAGGEQTPLGFFLTHGSGTRKGDGAELQALSHWQGSARGALPVTALKAHTGHMAAASDLAEIIFGLRALREGEVPGTHNFVGLEPEYAGLAVSAQPQSMAHSSFCSTSMGVGGQVSAVLVAAD